MTALLSEQAYRKLTADLRSPVAEVNLALTVAQGLVEVRLGRALGLGTYTESLRVYPSNTVYPTVTPLAVDTAGYLDSCTLQVDTTDVYDVWQPYLKATVTYTGGYDDDNLPYPLGLAISLVAKHLLTGASGTDLTGVVSYSEGDISATFDKPLDSTWPAGAWALAKRYAYREPASA